MVRRSLLGLLVLCAAYTGSAAAQSLPPEIAQSKKIRIATSATYPPMEFRDLATDKFVGFDVDLADAITKQLGVTVEWQDSAFGQLTPSVVSGRADMMISAISDLPVRWEQLDLIDYITSGSQFYTLAKNTEIKGLDDLCGKKVGTARSTSFPADIARWSAENCGKNGKPAIVFVGVDRMPLLVTEFQQGRIDAAVRSANTMPQMMQEEPGVYRVIAPPITHVLQGIGFAKTSSALREAVLTALHKLFADGTYRALLKKWNIESAAIDAPRMNTKPIQ
jgi:polar amino acid transport system substrate-binding protein